MCHMLFREDGALLPEQDTIHLHSMTEILPDSFSSDSSHIHLVPVFGRGISGQDGGSLQKYVIRSTIWEVLFLVKHPKVIE